MKSFKLPGYDFELKNLDDDDLKLLEEPYMVVGKENFFLCSSIENGIGDLFEIPLSEIQEFGRSEEDMDETHPYGELEGGTLYAKVKNTEGEETYFFFDFRLFTDASY